MPPKPSFKHRIFFVLFVLIFFVVPGFHSQVDRGLSTREVNLNELLHSAILNNYEMRMLKKDSAIAAENIETAKIARAPYINIGGYYNYVANPVLYRDFYSNDTTIEYYHQQASFVASLGIPIYTGGKINTQVELNQIDSRIQNEIMKMSANQLRLEIISQFYSLYRLYREVEIIEANISSVKINIQQLESKVENGQNLVSDLTRTQLQLSDFQIEVIKAFNNIDLLSNYLCILAGLPSKTRLIPDEVVVEIPGDTLDYTTCLETAFANRNEIVQSQMQKQYSETLLKMTRSNFKPSINGIANYNSNFPVPGTFPPQTDILNYMTVGVGISYDLSSIYNLNHRIKADKLQIERQSDHIEQVKNSIDQEVKEAYVRFFESKNNILLYEKNVELAELNYRIVKSKYDNEFALIIDMIDAELQVNDSKLSLNNAIIETIIQYYSLLYSMGTLNN